MASATAPACPKPAATRRPDSAIRFLAGANASNGSAVTSRGCSRGACLRATRRSTCPIRPRSRRADASALGRGAPRFRGHARRGKGPNLPSPSTGRSPCAPTSLRTIAKGSGPSPGCRLLDRRPVAQRWKSEASCRRSCAAISLAVQSRPRPMPGQKAAVLAHASSLMFSSQKGQVRHWVGRAW